MGFELRVCQICKKDGELVALRGHGTRRIKIADMDNGRAFVLLVECKRYRCPLCYGMEMDYSPAVSKQNKFTKKYAEFAFNNPGNITNGISEETRNRAIEYWKTQK